MHTIRYGNQSITRTVRIIVPAVWIRTGRLRIDGYGFVRCIAVLFAHERVRPDQSEA